MHSSSTLVRVYTKSNVCMATRVYASDITLLFCDRQSHPHTTTTHKNTSHKLTMRCHIGWPPFGVAAHICSGNSVVNVRFCGQTFTVLDPSHPPPHQYWLTAATASAVHIPTPRKPSSSKYLYLRANPCGASYHTCRCEAVLGSGAARSTA